MQIRTEQHGYKKTKKFSQACLYKQNITNAMQFKFNVQLFVSVLVNKIQTKA